MDGRPLSGFGALDVFGAGVGEGFFDALELGGVGAEFVGLGAGDLTNDANFFFLL